MSTITEILAGVRKVVLLEYRVTELAEQVKALDLREAETRERLTRIEGMITGAQMRVSAKRLR